MNKPMKTVTKIYFLQIKLKQLKRSESYLFNKHDLIDYKQQVNLAHQEALLSNARQFHITLLEQLQEEANRLFVTYNQNQEDLRNIKKLF